MSRSDPFTGPSCTRLTGPVGSISSAWLPRSALCSSVWRLSKAFSGISMPTRRTGLSPAAHPHTLSVVEGVIHRALCEKPDTVKVPSFVTQVCDFHLSRPSQASPAPRRTPLSLAAYVHTASIMLLTINPACISSKPFLRLDVDGAQFAGQGERRTACNIQYKEGQGATCGLKADDMQAAVYRPRLSSQHTLDFLPHRQHQPTDQVQRLDACTCARPPLGRALISLHPCFACLRPVKALVPAANKGSSAAASMRLISRHMGSTRLLTRYTVWMHAPMPIPLSAVLLYAFIHALPDCALSSCLYHIQSPSLHLW